MSQLGLDIGLKALLTSQTSLETIGHNLANSNTPGYSRQSVEVKTAQHVRIRGLLQGGGVEADMIKRTTDDLVQRRLLGQTSALTRLHSRLNVMQQAESLIVGSTEGGIQALIDNMFSTFSQLSESPEDLVLRSSVTHSVVDLANAFNQAARTGTSLADEAVDRLEGDVQHVNGLAERINDVNQQLQANETGTLAANDLRDERDRLLRELSGLVDIRTTMEGSKVAVHIGGHMLVSPSQSRSLETFDNGSGLPALRIKGADGEVRPTGGSIGGTMTLIEDYLPDLQNTINGFAHELILEMNRVHSTGMGTEGPYHQLVGSNTFADLAGDGDVTDERLSNAGLPFEMSQGELFVNVTDRATGEFRRVRLDIDPEQMSVQDLLDEFNRIPHISASIVGQGRFQLLSDSGFGVDFSGRLNPLPDPIGSFGGARASLGTAANGPFALAPGDTLDIAGPTGPISVTFNVPDFAEIGKATAAEIAAVINADPAVQTNQLVASAVGDNLVLQTELEGPAQSFTITGGTSLGAFGWTAGTVVTGQDSGVNIEAFGDYNGNENGALTFRPNMDGVIGTTDGLRIQVFDDQGRVVGDLDVGSSYTVGDALDVGNGISVRFGLGAVSAADNDSFHLHTIVDSDTTDLLPALGLNGLFAGDDAESMRIRDGLEDDPGLLAGSSTGAQADNAGILRLLDLATRQIDGLNGKTLTEGYADIVSGIGIDVSATSSAAESEELLLNSLDSRRDQLSGVNVDEELVNLIEAEQAYAAASQFIRVVNELTSELLNLL